MTSCSVVDSVAKCGRLMGSFTRLPELLISVPVPVLVLTPACYAALAPGLLWLLFFLLHLSVLTISVETILCILDTESLLGRNLWNTFSKHCNIFLLVFSYGYVCSVFFLYYGIYEIIKIMTACEYIFALQLIDLDFSAKQI